MSRPCKHGRSKTTGYCNKAGSVGAKKFAKANQEPDVESGSLWDLIDSSRTLIVEKPDEFLKKFDATSINNTVVSKRIAKFLKRNPEKIGNGAVGTIYSFDKNHMLKVSSICPRKKSKNMARLCDLAIEGDFIYRIPSTITNKKIILAPNYLLEPVIGMLLSSNMKQYTGGFMDTSYYQYDKDSKSLSILTEKLTPLYDKINNSTDMLYCVYSMIRSIVVAQQKYRYTHYDLHDDNVMAREDDVIRIYELENGNYIYTKFDFEPVAIDFGHTRIETDEFILTPRLNFTTNDVATNVPNYYVFDPLYDTFSILYMWVLKYIKLSNEFVPTSDNVNEADDILGFLFMVLTKFLGVKEEELLTVLESLKLKDTKWRADRLDYVSDKYNVITPAELLVYIESMFDKSPDDFNKLSNSELEKIINYDKIIVHNRLINIPGSIVYNYVPPKMRLNTQLYKHVVSEFAAFDSVYITQEAEIMYREPMLHIGAPGNGSQILHVAEIDQNVMNTDGYKFRFDCCRIDMHDYLKDPSINAGIVINASYFNIATDYGAIGYFKNEDFVSDNPIPKGFEKYYGIVGIDSTGYLHVDTTESRDKYIQVLSAGPLLMINGEKLIDYKKLEHDLNSDDEWVFRCDPTYKKEERAHKMTNCHMKPGSLFHASNMNPRSAIGVTADNKVIMVVVEGRNDRGSGYDMIQLINFFVNKGVINAICLDGGRSSQMMWKKPGEYIIEETNPTRTRHYPAGNSISYVRMS